MAATKWRPHGTWGNFTLLCNLYVAFSGSLFSKNKQDPEIADNIVTCMSNSGKGNLFGSGVEVGHATAAPLRNLVAGLALSTVVAACLLFLSLPQAELQWHVSPHKALRSEREGVKVIYPGALDELEEHVRTHGPATDFWPSGCQWRSASNLTTARALGATLSQRGTNAAKLDYWDEGSEQWGSGEPGACRAASVAVPVSSVGSSHVPVTLASGALCSKVHCIYSNLWMRAGRFYYVTESEEDAELDDWQLARRRCTLSATLSRTPSDQHAVQHTCSTVLHSAQGPDPLESHAVCVVCGPPGTSRCCMWPMRASTLQRSRT